MQTLHQKTSRYDADYYSSINDAGRELPAPPYEAIDMSDVNKPRTSDYTDLPAEKNRGHIVGRM